MTVRLPAAQLADIEAEAAQEDRARSNMVRILLKEAIDARRGKARK